MKPHFRRSLDAGHGRLDIMGQPGHQFLFSRVGFRLCLSGMFQLRPHQVKGFRKGTEKVLSVHGKGNVQISACNALGKAFQPVKRPDDGMVQVSGIRRKGSALDCHGGKQDHKGRLPPGPEGPGTVIVNNQQARRLVFADLQQGVPVGNGGMNAFAQSLPCPEQYIPVFIQHHIVQAGPVLVIFQIVPLGLHRVQHFVDHNRILGIVRIPGGEIDKNGKFRSKNKQYYKCKKT